MDRFAEYPALLAISHSETQWKAWCPWCRRYHYHGADGGHRAAHCVPDSPFSDSGYVLIHEDDTTPPREGEDG